MSSPGLALGSRSACTSDSQGRDGKHRLGPGRLQLEARACGFDPNINMDGVRSVIAVRLAADTD